MKRILLVSSFIFSTLLNYGLVPDEGMWIPLLIEKYNIKIMQEKGFKLTAEDVYSVNRACMKDAVVIFGGGCTGELISPEGLLITNHHCGYGQIQRHSTLDHDYLTNGFWAMSRDEELPNPGLTATILKRMEDVTERALENVNDSMEPDERERIIDANIEIIRREALDGTNYIAQVRPFYMGNQYFLFVSEVFRDVRLVGAPPSSIGKFGGDTDNWIWPRHTGDFSIFRVYADKDNRPADYSVDNVPYKPLYYFPVSLKGVKEGDFTMVFGYPGTTIEYVPSYHIDMVKNYLDPLLIRVRTRKIDIINASISSDPLLRIKYSAKLAGISNSWKRWQGEILGLDRLNTIGKKEEFESRLTQWINQRKSRQEKYGDILPSYKELYEKLKDFNLANNFTSEIINGIESVGFSRNMRSLVSLYENDGTEEDKRRYKDDLIKAAEVFFRDYDMETDRELFVSLMEMYGEALDLKWQSPEYLDIKKECGGNFTKLSEKIYERTIFSDEEKFVAFVREFGSRSVSRIKKDPFYRLSTGTGDFVSQNIRPELNILNTRLQNLNREYMQLQMDFDSTRIFYPDANSTLRVAFGTVQGYYPRDAVHYTYYTTLKGIMEKDNPEIYDYDVPDRLKELYEKHDFGRYACKGEIPVCFIANNHTTGGNSGSPVINAEGQLIGINFDREWEGVASDMAFDPSLSRNISLDIRYALFLIDKFAGAGYLLDEMTLVE